jgi:hypothetical protein
MFQLIASIREARGLPVCEGGLDNLVGRLVESGDAKEAGQPLRPTSAQDHVSPQIPPLDYVYGSKSAQSAMPSASFSIEVISVA